MPEDTALAVKEREFKDKAMVLLDQAKTFQIVDQPTYDEAGRIRREVVKPWRNSITEYHEPLKKKAKEAWQAIVDAEKSLVAPLDEADKLLEAKRITYFTVQEQKRREEQRRLDEEARKQEEERKLQEATAAEQSGAAPEDVDAIVESPSIAPPPAAAPTVVKTEGVSIRTTWKAALMTPESKNFLLLVKHIAKTPELLGLLKLDGSALNAMARAQKALLKLPGVRVYQEKSEAVR